MAEGFQPLTIDNLKTTQGVSELNRMFQILFDNVAGNTNDVRVYNGYGSPEGVVAANVGSLYQRLDGASGSCFYIKETGTDATGWVTVGASGGTIPGNPLTSIQFNDSGVFGGDAQLTFQKLTNTFTSNSFVSNPTSISVASDFPMAFNGVDGDTKFIYDSDTDYFQLYLNGVIRAEF